MNEALERIVNLRPSASALVNHYLKKKKAMLNPEHHFISQELVYVHTIILLKLDNYNAITPCYLIQFGKLYIINSLYHGLSEYSIQIGWKVCNKNV